MKIKSRVISVHNENMKVFESILGMKIKSKTFRYFDLFYSFIYVLIYLFWETLRDAISYTFDYIKYLVNAPFRMLYKILNRLEKKQ